MIEPVAESRSDFYIFRDLCRKMGNPDLWPWETERELCDWKLEPLGIAEGNWVRIETKHGKARFKAKVTKRIHPKVISVCHGWWYPELPAPAHGVFESNTNVLVDPQGATDPASGTTELRGLLCKAYKADGPPQGVKDNSEV